VLNHSSSREDEFSFYQNHVGSTDKKKVMKNVERLEAIVEDPQFTFSGDKRESIHQHLSTDINLILPKSAAALFASMDNHEMEYMGQQQHKVS
jgi:hypothetical protein